jgi:hypothetical protein
MLVLSMTASRPNMPPSIILDELYQIAYFHIPPSAFATVVP